MALGQAQEPAPSATDGLGGAFNGIGQFLSDNAGMIVVLIGLVILLIAFLAWLGRRVPTKGIQRDALVILSKDMIKSAKMTPAHGSQDLWLTGSELFPPKNLGRVLGYHRGVDAMWYAVRRGGWFARPKLVVCLPDDIVTSHESREIHVSGVGVESHRGFYAIVPDVHDEREWHRWSKAAGRRSAPRAAAAGARSSGRSATGLETVLYSPARVIDSASALSEFFKEWYTSVIANQISVDESLLASQDRHFLRQWVTYSEKETLPQTDIVKPSEPTVGSAGGQETDV